MQIFKKLVLAALIAGSGLVAQSAMATEGVQAFGNLTAQQVSDSSGGFTLSFGNNFTTTDSKGYFDDGLLFTIGSNFQSGGSVSSNFTSVQALTLTEFNLVQYTTNSVGDTVILSTLTGKELAPNYFTLNASNLAQGSYYLEIAGTVDGVNGGSYGGSLNVTTVAAAVPEPATYGMLLGGLGLIGFVARRKKQS